mmetsp:Transcript_28138/g.83842  ORF Transcript_28138/g.83842 Transcript_28138/m.83842 type:complete len:244 (+) Transcript_28138:786-1517(+)
MTHVGCVSTPCDLQNSPTCALAAQSTYLKLPSRPCASISCLRSARHRGRVRPSPRLALHVGLRVWATPGYTSATSRLYLGYSLAAACASRRTCPLRKAPRRPPRASDAALRRPRRRNLPGCGAENRPAPPCRSPLPRAPAESGTACQARHTARSGAATRAPTAPTASRPRAAAAPRPRPPGPSFAALEPRGAAPQAASAPALCGRPPSWRWPGASARARPRTRRRRSPPCQARAASWRGRPGQ